MTKRTVRAPRVPHGVLVTRVVVVAVTMSVVVCLWSQRPVAQALGPTAGRAPEFAVASVEPSKSGDTGKGATRLQAGGRFTATNVTLRTLIETAYQRHGFDRVEIAGGPVWIDADRFDVVAKAPSEHVLDPDGFPRQTWRMLRMLLADRFKLRVHKETKEVPIYALRMATSDGKLGPGLRKSDTDCVASMKAEIEGQWLGKGHHCYVQTRYPCRLGAGGVTMPVVASLLSELVDRMVVDQTGLDGHFDLELEAVEIRASAVQGPSSRPSKTTQSIFAALPQQLGLRLVPMMGSAMIIVVDSAVKSWRVE
ncbi:MAG: TIGR03435 family protein [Luteitalea sp.]|nr:TIGR03435 family protein [Luteitalea sp.]